MRTARRAALPVLVLACLGCQPSAPGAPPSSSAAPSETASSETAPPLGG